MKITDFLIEHNLHTKHRYCKNPILNKSKIFSFFGFNRIEYYIYCKYWHSVHTKEEMKSSYFFCVICEQPDYFDEYFSLWLENRLTTIFTGLLRFLLKLKIHIWHIFALSMMTHSGCGLCGHKYFKNWTIEMLKKYRFWDVTKPPKRSDDIYWGDN